MSVIDDSVVHFELPTVVEFYSEYCGHCMGMEPIIKEVITPDSGINFVAQKIYESSEYDYLLYDLEVIAVPTFVALFPNNEVCLAYEGSMPAEVLKDFVSFVKNNCKARND